MVWFFRDQLRPFAKQVAAQTEKPDPSDTGRGEEVVDPPSARRSVPEVASTNPAPGTPAPSQTAPAPPKAPEMTIHEPAVPPATGGTVQVQPVPSVAPVPPSPPAPDAPALARTTEPPNDKPAVPATAAPDVPAETLAPPQPKKALPVEPSMAETPSGKAPASASPLVEVPRKAIPADAGPSGDAPAEPIYVKAGKDSQPAADALQKFFKARSLAERLALTQAADKVRPLMERYYEANPDGPVRVKSIELLRHDRNPEIGAPLCVFQVSGPDVPEPLPVMAESTPDGWKIDWLTFTEFKDKLLLLFLQKWQDGPARFHVLMRRTHYFDEDVPELDRKSCFELTSPVPGFQGFAFVPKGSALGQELDRSVGWDVSGVAAVVELQWKKKDRYQWVEITALPQYNWRSNVAAANAQPAKLSPGEPQKAQPLTPPKPASVAKKN
jgi:hypothetical protein